MMWQCPSCGSMSVPEEMEPKANFERYHYECSCGCCFIATVHRSPEAKEEIWRRFYGEDEPDRALVRRCQDCGAKLQWVSEADQKLVNKMQKTVGKRYAQCPDCGCLQAFC